MIKEIFGKKVGMTQIFNEEGNLVGVTLIEVEPICVLEEVKYPTKKAVKIGFMKVIEKKVKKLKKPVLGYFNKMKVSPYKFIREVAMDETKVSTGESKADKKTAESGAPEQEIKESAVITGRKFGVEIFKEGEIVDVRSKSKGKGFSGGMKRHGWSGQPKTHGSMTHRRLGSAGSSSFPSRIIKGLGMPGHMGNVYRTVKNTSIIKVDKDKNLLFVKGGIPGSRGTIVKIVKK